METCLAALLVVVMGVLLVMSPGTTKPFVDREGKPLPGSISEKLHVKLNGVNMGMFIKGKDTTKPVLLFLHGGPGMPGYFLDGTHPTGLENDFVVVWWDQRGAGLSHRGVPRASMTMDQMISDTIAVTDYLRRRFHQDKIYLIGHSWGSFLGIQAAAQAPQLYHAYIGMGQVVYQRKSEVIAYQYELAQYKSRGDEKMVSKLEAAPMTMDGPMPAAYRKLRDEAMHRLGIGTTHGMDSVISGVFLPVWRTRDYTIREKIDIGRGKSFSQGIFWDALLDTDLTSKIHELEVPACFFSGKYDLTVNHYLSKAFLGQLKAPVKGFYTFEHSAHSPVFEEPARARQILEQDVLTGRNDLADPL